MVLELVVGVVGKRDGIQEIRVELSLRTSQFYPKEFVSGEKKFVVLLCLNLVCNVNGNQR